MSVEVKVFFNFRSPYCYLASKTMWTIFDDYDAKMTFLPVGGWSLRSDPDRAKIKLPIARQDMKRFAKRLGIPVNPPPMETEPTPAGAASLYALSEGKIREYIIETMREEWEFGNNIALKSSLSNIAKRCNLDEASLMAASEDETNLKTLQDNSELASKTGVIGVPTFVIGDEIFWGQDRIDFVTEYLTELGAAKS